ISVKLGRKAKDEQDLILQRDSQESFEDLSQLTSQHSVRKTQNKAQHQGQGEGQQGSIEGESTKALDIREFTAVFSQFVMGSGTDLKKKLDILESKLRSRGVSEKELLALKLDIKKSIRSEISQQIKDEFFKVVLSKEKSIEWVINKKGTSDLIAFVVENDKVGGHSFGGHLKNLTGTTREMGDRGREELREFVKEDLESRLVEKHLSGADNKKEIEDLLKLGAKVGFDSQKFINEWPLQSLHLGMNYLDPKFTQGGSFGDNRGKQGNSGYELSQDEEKDILTNRLRALYMQRAIKGDYLTQITTSYKIKKLKNGLIKLGVQIGDFEKVEKEGEGIARMKAMEMLKEVFYERATLYELSGPAYDLMNKRIKTILSTLERLGVQLSKMELDSLRDKANYSMFDTARNEIEHCGMVEPRNPAVDRRQQLLVKLLKRLKEESNIEAYGFDISKFEVIKSAA
ncbi:MAG: hypothetical protein WC624_06880, partial [Candidatus Margulisiibacteriota bacterium]